MSPKINCALVAGGKATRAWRRETGYPMIDRTIDQ
jgi:hypothetical protein